MEQNVVLNTTLGMAALYPLIRLQTLRQTQLGYSFTNSGNTLGNYLSNFNLAKKESMAGLFKGLPHFLSYQALRTTILVYYSKLLGTRGIDTSMTSYLHSLFASLLSAGVAYPFELNQIKVASAANSSNANSSVTMSEVVKTFQAPSNWTGFSLLYSRYALLTTSIFINFNGQNNLLSLLLALGSIPLDVIRRNYVLTQFEKGSLPYKNVLECTKQLIQTHGYKCLFRGFLTYPEIYLAYFFFANNISKASQKSQH